MTKNEKKTKVLALAIWSNSSSKLNDNTIKWYSKCYYLSSFHASKISILVLNLKIEVLVKYRSDTCFHWIHLYITGCNTNELYFFILYMRMRIIFLYNMHTFISFVYLFDQKLTSCMTLYDTYLKIHMSFLFCFFLLYLLVLTKFLFAIFPTSICSICSTCSFFFSSFSSTS